MKRLLAAMVVISGCASAPVRVCIPGESRLCVCPGGLASAQVCSDDGTRLGACACGPAADGGMDARSDLEDDLGVVPGDDAGDGDDMAVMGDDGIDGGIISDDAGTDLGPPVVCSSGYPHVRTTGEAVCISKGGGAECTAAGGTVLEWASVSEQHDWMAFFAATPALGGGGCVGLSRSSLVSGWTWASSGADASSEIMWPSPAGPTGTGLQAALHSDMLIAVSCPGGGSSWICVRAAP